MDRALLELDLDEFVEGETWPDAQEDNPDEPVPVASNEIANQVLRRLKRLERESIEVNRVAADEIARISQWRDDRLAGVARDVAWGKRSLENYMRSLGAAKKVRSQKLPGGTLKLTKPSERITVIDEKVFLEWCGVVFPDPDVPDGEKPQPIVAELAHPEFVRLKPEVAKVTVKAALKVGEWEPGLDNNQVAQLLLDLGEAGIEIVPGVVLERDREDKFDVKLGAE